MQRICERCSIEDFKKNLNLNRYFGIEETMLEEVKEVEETEKIENNREDEAFH